MELSTSVHFFLAISVAMSTIAVYRRSAPAWIIPHTVAGSRNTMLKQFTLAVLLNGLVFAQNHTPIAHYDQLDEIPKIECKAPEGFGCAILWDVELPTGSDMIASVVGGVVYQISVILEHTMYTVVYDPPLPRDARARRRTRAAARVIGDNLIIRWADGTAWKGRIVNREKIDPDRPRPA